jgi:hypothetical protein
MYTLVVVKVLVSYVYTGSRDLGVETWMSRLLLMRSGVAA